MAKVEISLKAPLSAENKILVDGIEIPNVRSITFNSVAGKIPEVHLIVLATELIIDAESNTFIHEEK